MRPEIPTEDLEDVQEDLIMEPEQSLKPKDLLPSTDGEGEEEEREEEEDVNIIVNGLEEARGGGEMKKSVCKLYQTEGIYST